MPTLKLTGPIADAVMPLKIQAMARARKEAVGYVAGARESLASRGWDINKAAPTPSSKSGVAEYFTALSRRHNFLRLTELAAPRDYSRDEMFVRMSEEGVDKFLADAQADAAAQYDAFVDKLVRKIGPVVSARLEGDHVWSYSHLHVVKADGSKERYRTHMIVNMSKHGKFFNQWPTRKVKE